MDEAIVDVVTSSEPSFVVEILGYLFVSFPPFLKFYPPVSFSAGHFPPETSSSSLQALQPDHC